MPNTYPELIWSLLAVAGVVIAIIVSFKNYFEAETKKVEIKSKETIELKKADIELAKNNVFQASQITRFLQDYQVVIKDLENVKRELSEIKTDNEEKTHEILEQIDKIETAIKSQNQNLIDSIIGKAFYPPK